MTLFRVPSPLLPNVNHGIPILSRSLEYRSKMLEGLRPLETLPCVVMLESKMLISYAGINVDYASQ